MSSAWDDLGGRRETYAEAMARAVVLQPRQESEQEAAERIVAGRERMRRHDAHFAPEFLSIDEERLISRELARQLGHIELRAPRDERLMDDDDGINGDN